MYRFWIRHSSHLKIAVVQARLYSVGFRRTHVHHMKDETRRDWNRAYANRTSPYDRYFVNYQVQIIGFGGARSLFCLHYTWDVSSSKFCSVLPQWKLVHWWSRLQRRIPDRAPFSTDFVYVLPWVMQNSLALTTEPRSGRLNSVILLPW